MDCESFLAMNIDRFPGRPIFAKVWGSKSHNTDVPTSDTDYLVVYLTPLKKLLSLSPPADTVSNPEGSKPDYQAHEAGKFSTLLLKGNPSMVEMLFTDKMVFETPLWQRLKKERKRFLCAESVRQYLGYVQGQMARLFKHGGKSGLHSKGGAYNEKWAYHIVRLLYDAERIAKGAEPVVWKDEGSDERNLLMKIRAGQITQEAVESIARQGIARIDAMKPWQIPEEGDKQLLEDWLLDLRGVRNS